MRVRNPETFYATWASSAPTQAAIDMWTYSAQAERSMTRNCSADFTAVTRYVDGVLVNGTDAEKHELKKHLFAAVLSGPQYVVAPSDIDTEAKELSNVQIAEFLQLPLRFYQHYGFRHSVQPFCDILETMNRTHIRTTDNGGIAPALASESGIAMSHNITAAWEAFLVGITEIDYDKIPYWGDLIMQNSWAWQYCSEYGPSFLVTNLPVRAMLTLCTGYYQRGNPDNPHTIMSLFISLQFFQNRCNHMFPEGLPPYPNVSGPNKYGGWHMNPSNTMFSSGEFDPWRALSPASIEDDSPKRRTTQLIPKCNVSPANDTIFGIIYQDQVHVSIVKRPANASFVVYLLTFVPCSQVSDMRAVFEESSINHERFSAIKLSSPSTVEPFYAGVGLFQSALEVWLPCFGGYGHGDMKIQFPDAIG